MISKSNFREVLLSLEFEEFKPGMFRKSWPEIEIGCEMLAYFPSADKPLGKLVYPNGTDINDGYANVKDAINDLPVIVFGDHSCTFKYVDFPFVRGADGTQLLKFDSDLFDVRFMCHYLRHQKIENQDRYERNMKYLKQLEIKVPAGSEQKKIVGQIDTYEAETQKAGAKLSGLDMQKKEVLMQYLKGGEE